MKGTPLKHRLTSKPQKPHFNFWGFSDTSDRKRAEYGFGEYGQDFPRSYRALPAGPTPLDPTPSEALPPDLLRTRFRPDFDPIRT